jgi:hypothetical protein
MAALSFPALGAATVAQATSVEENETFTPDGAWCWFSDPRAVYRNGTIYAGWMSSDGSVQVGARDQKTGALTVATLAEKFERDDHDHPSLLFLPDGRLVAFYSLHAKADTHQRVTAKPEDINEWTPDRTIGFANTGIGPHGVTYANPVMLNDEANAIYLFWRGSDFKPTFSISTDLGKTWSKPRTLIQRAGTGTDVRPYVKLWSDGRGRIDFIFTDGHPRNEPTNSVYFLRYEKGAFFKADGTRIGSMNDLPLDPVRCDRIYDGATAGRAWIWDVCEDRDNNPVVAYTRLPAENDHRYHYARWNGKQWVDSEITGGVKWFPRTPPGKQEREPHYSGGMALDPVNPATVYASRPVKGIFEIERWTTRDGGKTWRSEAVTKNSKADNVRPFVVRNTPAGTTSVMWMYNGGGYVHFTDYKTEIRIRTFRTSAR